MPDALDPARTRDLVPGPTRTDARYVVYLVDAAHRARHNPALEEALHLAGALGLPVVAAFALDTHEPGLGERSAAYLLDGLVDLRDALAARGVAFAVRYADPATLAHALAPDAAALVLARGYLRHQRAWRARLARETTLRVREVEGDVVVPVDVVTDKREWAARTIRPKLWRHAEAYLVRPTPQPVAVQAGDLALADGLPPVDLDDLGGVLAHLRLNDRAAPVALEVGGERAADLRFERFLTSRFAAYAAHRNQPQTDDVSHLSKALRYGHLSVVDVALRARDAANDAANDAASLDAFLEELVVRRELAINFVAFSEDYDAYATLPPWARTTLAEHASDARDEVYDEATFEAAATHDPYWNAAMREMRATGYMHNYMRMYWGKKVLEWTPDPEAGFELVRTLNDRWFLDGRSPNGYAGVAWTFGLHDRAWTERAVFGKVRYMNAAGLQRKADPDAYVAKVARLEADAHAADAERFRR